MAVATIFNIGTAPAGTISQYSLTLGSLTHIAGAQNTTPGRYLHKTASLPGTDSFRFFHPILALELWLTADFTPAKYAPAAGSVNGVIGPWIGGAVRLPKNGAGWLGLVASSVTGTQPQIFVVT